MKNYFYESDDFDDSEDFTPGQMIFFKQLMMIESMKTKPVESKIKLIDAVMTMLPQTIEGEDLSIDVSKGGGAAYVSITGKSLNIKNPYMFSKIIQTSPCVEVVCKTNCYIDFSLGYYKVFEMEDR